MKEVFDNKKKLLLFEVILFFFTGVIINLIPTNIKSITTAIIYSLYFLVLSYFYGKDKENAFDLPTILMIIYMITGYITIFNIMSGKKIIFAFALGTAGYLLAYVQKKLTQKNNETTTKNGEKKIKNIKEKPQKNETVNVLTNVIDYYNNKN